MRSRVVDVLPSSIKRSMAKLGADLRIARIKRQVTVAMMTERLGISKSTYVRVEKGDPTVAMGVYGMALFVLGFGGILGEVIDPAKDDRGLLLDEERLPKRVRVIKTPQAL